ncbi:protein translocase subunit SecY [Paenibacillus larvae subsp. larvae]|uniref:Protein translocase subunit SecY n=1 Tax=Paenibacillus larvae subsp. larvae TaxID=147375 RepID=A0A2L1U6H9_9BACL|nr:preprotein translocase subunit SecY [Paenibacillus larvae]AQT84776.1 preprotein translocase subunit SecY [Paenibacillus larvae subsp. pulvifaciens]AQZ46770.1 preprotein translocase subunit SecY [Paenibacillus larvae subsp. pulvifaciens]AVF28530.1 protein translocase subunit SecY [Paenibacillus larvae subsp. larvae]AVF33035.1 protein translocase subunit SecY [Paenibacillus larvae subsp. larvae]MBH0344209.1 preprotein translocase subunit SecY [Paenibacillus larvae]
MFRTLSNIFKVEDLRKRIIFTLLVLIIYRLGSFIPVPNINTELLKVQDQATQADVFGLLNTFSGGALFQFSIFAMGIVPYITASIIVQLLSMDVVPKFTQWSKEGEVGRKKITQVTRYGTIILGLIQAFGLAIGFNRMFNGLVKDPSFTTYAMIAIVITAGTAFLMWLGEQITENGIGNGISIIIFSGIVAGIPGGIHKLFIGEFINADGALFLNIVKVVLLVVVVIAIIVGVIFVQQGVRKIPVQYAKRVVGRKMYGGQSTHIPLKVNAAGVIPVIFAISLLSFPVLIANFWAGSAVTNWINAYLNLNNSSPLAIVLYVLLIIGFTYFYTFVQINPVQMADQMKKNGGYIPGVRPGKPTSGYLTKVMSRITLSGAIFLALISILPMILGAAAGLDSSIRIGGTSLLILVGVGLETMKQIESQLMKRHYKGFINK